MCVKLSVAHSAVKLSTNITNLDINFLSKLRKVEFRTHFDVINESCNIFAPSISRPTFNAHNASVDGTDRCLQNAGIFQQNSFYFTVRQQCGSNARALLLYAQDNSRFQFLRLFRAQTLMLLQTWSMISSVAEM
jgi:hypothetical protein